MWNIAENIQTLSYIAAKAPCGFPSPADDHLENELNIHDLLVTKKAASFIICVSGDSMEGAGIFDGDYVVVDKSKKPVPGQIVLAVLHGDMTVKHFAQRDGLHYLESTNPFKYPPLLIDEENPPELWGVVVGVARKCV